MIDTATLTVLVGFFGLAIGQITQLVRQSTTERNLRSRDLAAAKVIADTLAAAAKLVDERAAMERKNVIEDRAFLAADIAAKLKVSEDAIAAKAVAAAADLALKLQQDNADKAQVLRDHTERLAAMARADQLVLGRKFDAVESKATVVASEIKTMLNDNTILTTENGLKADAAYHEANGAKLLIAEEVRRRNDIHQAQAQAAASASPLPVEVVNQPLTVVEKAAR